MKKLNGIHENFASQWWVRWAMIAMGAAVAALLGSTIETGRVHAQATTGGFEFMTALNRFITPNGDGINDSAMLCFNNPKDSGVRGEIFDLRGNKVADMEQIRNADDQVNFFCPSAGPAPNDGQAVRWDGKMMGRPATSGIYVYLIQAEDTAYTGTILVVR